MTRTAGGEPVREQPVPDEAAIRFVGPAAPNDRACPACGQDEDHLNDPRHLIGSVRFETKQATLPDGTVIPVQVPIDEAYHFDCHAKMGCDNCKELLAAYDGSVKGKAAALETGIPEHLVDIAPHEFSIGDAGVLTRVAEPGSPPPPPLEPPDDNAPEA